MRSGGKTSPSPVSKIKAKSFRGAEVRPAGDEGNVPRAAPPKSPRVAAQHIGPHICDLTEEQKKRIAEFRRRKKAEQDKLIRRMREVEEALARLEEIRNARLRENEELEEFYGDRYELVRGRKKRLKRSARRASMVTLGVKQRIMWWKEPEIAVIYNHAYKLRHENNTYCATHSYELPHPRAVNYGKPPLIPVHINRTFAGRAGVNLEKKERLRAELDDPRPLFVTAFSC